MTPAVAVADLRKRYGAHQVLKGLTFQVEQGEIFALLGVNGAGKTTALECIEGQRQPDGGSVTLRGKRGIQLQNASLPAHIRPMEAVKLFAKWKGAKISSDMLEELGIPQLGKRQYRELSTGQKRRLHLALALIGEPELLFLDEPTAGLDVEGRIALHRLIQSLKGRGRTILLASHDMAEVESLCDRIAILNRGEMAFLGTVPQLTQAVGRRYHITIRTPTGEETYQSQDITQTLLSLLEGYRSRNIPILDLKVDRGTLEEHFLLLAKGETT